MIRAFSIKEPRIEWLISCNKIDSYYWYKACLLLWDAALSGENLFEQPYSEYPNVMEHQNYGEFVAYEISDDPTFRSLNSIYAVHVVDINHWDYRSSLEKLSDKFVESIAINSISEPFDFRQQNRSEWRSVQENAVAEHFSHHDRYEMHLCTFYSNATFIYRDLDRFVLTLVNFDDFGWSIANRYDSLTLDACRNIQDCISVSVPSESFKKAYREAVWDKRAFTLGGKSITPQH